VQDHRPVNSSEHYYLGVLPEKTVEDMRKRYANPARKYHTWRHVQEMFDVLEVVDERVACLPALVLATVFHDAVYDAKRKDNEVKSAQLMRRTCAKMAPYWVEQAENMILATQHHVLPEGDGSTSDTAYFLDMDLAILAAPAERYLEYTQQIRQEYKHASDAEFAAGRAAALRKFLQRPAIYYTEWGAVMFERKARANITAELAVLEASGD
jgi:predicted metal-dependent HD superfamily phosphohydrolase